MSDAEFFSTDVTTWSLEMHDPAELRPSSKPAGDFLLIRAEIPSPEFSRYLYASVGADWFWTNRLYWPRERWRNLIEESGHETWVLYDRGTPAGYFELEAYDAGTVEIVYFGLMPGFQGKGLGGYLLTEAILAGWSLGDRWEGIPATTRVWVHTCSLDGQPAALNNYQARGLKLFKTVTEPEELPSVMPSVWPEEP